MSHSNPAYLPLGSFKSQDATLKEISAESLRQHPERFAIGTDAPISADDGLQARPLSLRETFSSYSPGIDIGSSKNGSEPMDTNTETPNVKHLLPPDIPVRRVSLSHHTRPLRPLHRSRVARPERRQAGRLKTCSNDTAARLQEMAAGLVRLEASFVKIQKIFDEEKAMSEQQDSADVTVNTAGDLLKDLVAAAAAAAAEDEGVGLEN
ncbi:Fc.00g102300.m01.CDS01 [Cosmosporella sp. VM-42]